MELFGFQDVLFENTNGMLRFEGNELTNALWSGDGKPGFWMSSVSRMGAIIGLLCEKKSCIWIEASDLYWEGFCTVEKRGLYGCEEVLRKSVEKNPFAGEQLVVLGQIYLGQGRFEEAEKESEERLRLILEWGSPWIRECCGKVGMLVAEFWLSKPRRNRGRKLLGVYLI
ncbi:hypothetical protein CTI12_AA460490 [Artemisia annua]|uniref:Uncharacterized protein n=1 Tax=Artemisia annua TaxID=35608 RepID=A0A2U1LFI2_ARTAN|nr:hypothetical protein CTI12_AA460490 [Artemisia annua]